MLPHRGGALLLLRSGGTAGRRGAPGERSGDLRHRRVARGTVAGARGSDPAAKGERRGRPERVGAHPRRPQPAETLYPGRRRGPTKRSDSFVKQGLRRASALRIVRRRPAAQHPRPPLPGPVPGIRGRNYRHPHGLSRGEQVTPALLTRRQLTFFRDFVTPRRLPAQRFLYPAPRFSRPRLRFSRPRLRFPLPAPRA